RSEDGRRARPVGRREDAEDSDPRAEARVTAASRRHRHPARAIERPAREATRKKTLAGRPSAAPPCRTKSADPACTPRLELDWRRSRYNATCGAGVAQ